MDETPMRLVTRERQELAEMERQYNELNEQAEELWDLLERKRARLAGIGHPVPLDG
ncbi:hypothetical protein N9X71_05500 [Paracoccus sp. (in: a-proteobacteria)]|uniref:hypothetical protein n=1 Tax=Paracoccus sp. TaxID=267 RepID=UPI00236CF80A|nr:hypothetical protein [Paracoccus sp. (in: a-proteobacteria)]